MRIQASLTIGALLAGGCTPRDEPQNNVTGDQPAVATPASAPGSVEQSSDAGNVATSPAASKPAPAASPCLIQDGETLQITPVKAIGTEPFWGVRIEGRCVTYSTPENEKGTRVWTRFKAEPQGGIWLGALGGRKFELRTRTAAGCSDGMSDKRYPIEVTLTVSGEERRGCAESVKQGPMK